MMYDYFSGKDKKESDSTGYGYSDSGYSSGGGGSSYAHYRSFTEVASDYVPWEKIDTGRKLFVSAVKKDSCLSRAICHSGSYARGLDSFVEIVEMILPKHFRKNFEIFKDSVLNRTNCKSSYKCKYLDGALDSYNELSNEISHKKSGEKIL